MDFSQDAIKVAKELIGYQIEFNGKKSIIIETEAYKDDKASHAYKKTPRSRIMYDTFGQIYIYLIYGMYHCLNFTTNKNQPGAVLIRGLKPLNYEAKTDGPGKLTKALNITKKLNNQPISKHFKLTPPKIKSKIKATERIGISQDKHLKWRFIIK